MKGHKVEIPQIKVLSLISLKVSVSLIIPTPLPDQLVKMRQLRSRVSADKISALGRSTRTTIFSAAGYLKKRRRTSEKRPCCTAPRGRWWGWLDLIFGYRWAAEGLKPWPCLGQRRKCTPSIDDCFCIHNSYRKSNRSCKKYLFNRDTRNYAPCLGQRGQKPTSSPGLFP